MTNKFSNFLSVSSGVIGDFLMTVNLAENFYLSSGEKIKTTIFASRNAYFLEELLGDGYPYIKIVPINFKGLISSHIFSLILSKNLVVLPMLFKGYPFKSLFFMKLFCLWPGSCLVGFSGVSPYSWYNKFFYTTEIVFDLKREFFDNLLATLNIAGLSVSFSIPRLHLRQRVESLAAGDVEGKYIVFHVAASRPRRTLPVKRWSSLVNDVLAIDDSISIVFTGSPADSSFVEQIIGGKDSQRCKNLAGKINASALLRVIDRAILYVGVDTGITHLAAMLEKEMVVLGHNESPTWLPSYNKKALILVDKSECVCKGDNSVRCTRSYDGREYTKCMLGVSNEKILASIRQKLSV
ncbi:MAG: glycosyltransferase family 9 protein [Candidatus Paceibacterota bacterium]|jgi:hypothetical protein